jgi:hypothetical protein
MKKTLLLAIIVISIATLCSCGNITVKGADGTEYESYQECCAANDYEAAHKYLAKMQDDAWYGVGERKSAKEYVFKHEALFLMSIGDEDAKKRIVYLLKEEGNNNNHVSMLIDLAIENDDEAFVKTLANQYSKGANQENLRKLKDYLLQKADSNYEFILSLFKKMGYHELQFETALQCKDYEFIKEHVADSLSFKRENLLNLLSGIKDKGISEQIVGLLTPLENNIPLRPKLGNFYNHMWEVNDYYDYQKAVKNYNEHCSTLLNFAIKNGNQFLAERIMKKFKSNIVYNEVKSGYRKDDGAYFVIYNSKIDNSEINSAKAAYQEAVRSGAFK